MGVIYLIIDTYNYFIIPMREWTELLCYFFLSIKLLFFGVFFTVFWNLQGVKRILSLASNVILRN